MDWFERLTGFQEGPYVDTKAKLGVDREQLVSHVNGRSYRVGKFDMASLAELRERTAAAGGKGGRPRVSVVTGDVGLMHQAPEYGGALFQVASQTNCLEMVGPSITPEHGVTGYQHDRTQGPACAIAAGAATIYRNYFAPVGDQRGQTAARQLDGLADLGAALSAALDRPVRDLWETRNGYALATRAGLDLISSYLASVGPKAIDDLRGRLRIGVHADVEVTAAAALRARSCRRRSAARCRWPTAGCQRSTGLRSPHWCSRRPTRPRCWRPRTTARAADRTSCC